MRQVFLPVSLTWDAFETKNGTSIKENFVNAIYRYRRTDRSKEPDPIIGSLILATPFFFEEQDWIPVPKSWAPNIVQGKTYNTETVEGMQIFNAVQQKLALNASVLEEGPGLMQLLTACY